MDFILESVQHNWPLYLVPLATFLLVVALGAIVRRILFRTLEKWATKSSGQLDDIAVAALRGPFLLWVVIAGIYAATQTSELPTRATGLVSQALLVLWIVSLTAVASRLAGALVKFYGRSASSVLPVTTLTQSLASLAVATIGILILLDTLHISVTPILTALGVGGIAVALALQDTLSNLFAGFYVSLAGQVRLGDYIKLESGEEGFVTDISWRSTTIRALANNLIVIPNAKLAQIIVTNYYLPEKRMSLLIPVGVSYSHDPEVVERILLEEANAGAGVIPGFLADPPPAVRFIPGFGDSSINFTVICQVAEFVDQYLVQHEMRKRIFQRFRQEGIEIPFPIRTVHLKQST
jgi:small-conductance mechanosensitive channel